MGLTRGFLKGMNLTEEQVGAIIEEHISVVNGLKEEVAKLKENADKYPSVQKELDELKKNNVDWKARYDSEHDAFETFKKEQSDKETVEKMKSAYRQLLLDANVREKHIDTILRVTDFSKMKLNNDGTLDDAKKIAKDIETSWSEFITTSGTKKTDVSTPPNNANGNVLTKQEIMKIKDTTERQKAWAEYLSKGE